jgi:hypothetical protein
MRNTERLIDRLAAGAIQGSRFKPTTTILLAATASMLVVVLLSVAWLKPRDDFALLVLSGNLTSLLKIMFPIAVFAAAVPIVRDLSVPGGRVGWRLGLIAVPFLAIMVLATQEASMTPASTWIAHESRFDCLWKIPALAIPAFCFLMVGVRHLAPTNLSRAGAYVGLAAGGIGAVGYAIRCHDDSIVFVAVAYTIAIAEMSLLGALMGPRLLRWSR